MLFGGNIRKRDLRIFKVPDSAHENKQVPMRLVIGLLTPFIIVALFLLFFSRKADLSTVVLKPGLPSEPVMTTPLPVIEAQKPLSHTKKKIIRPTMVSSQRTLPSQERFPAQETLSSQETLRLLTRQTEDIAVKPLPPTLKPLKRMPIPVKEEPVVTAIIKPMKEEPKIPTPAIALAPSIIEPESPPPAAVVPPSEIVEMPRVELPTPAVVPTASRFTIQVGSFSKKEDADRLASRLGDHGHVAYVVMANVANKGPWYRVRVGKYQDRPSALDAAEKLGASEQLSFIITPDR